VNALELTSHQSISHRWIGLDRLNRRGHYFGDLVRSRSLHRPWSRVPADAPKATTGTPDAIASMRGPEPSCSLSETNAPAWAKWR